jgi:anti-sigma factor RsiW
MSALRALNHRDRKPGLRMPSDQPDRPISEDELHAYVDGAIEPVRRLDIALYLARHPDEAARMEVFRAQREAIHALFDDILHRPVPRHLHRVVRRHGVRRARRWRATVSLLWIAAAALVLVTGGTVLKNTDLDRDRSALPAAARAPAAGELPVLRPVPSRRQRDRNFDI